MSRFLFGLLFGGAVLFSPLAQGATLTVTSGGDAGGTCPGPDCTLRQAIATASSGDTIDFANTLTTINLTSRSLFIDKDLTISGYEALPVTIRRVDTSVNFRIFETSSGDHDVTLSGLVITNGRLVAELTSGLAGSGIFYNSSGVLTITGCTISNNSAVLRGGGIFNIAAGTVVITNSTISSNGAGNSGGGIFNLGQMTIASSTISGNGADGPGGGIWNSGSLFITSSTISGNDAHQFSSGTAPGGGIYNSTDGAIALINTTVSNNSISDGDGGGISNLSGGTVSARNTIIAANTASFGGAPDFGGALTSQGFNLIGNNFGATIASAQATDQIGTAGSPINPGLGDLQSNGGLRHTQALLPGSTAIDKGHSSGSNSDQRGFTRPVDDPAVPNAVGSDGGDIGAFEVQRPTPTPARSLNISTRSRVHAGGKAMIGGFIITGNVPKRVIVRALGPSLQGFGLTGVLADPVVYLSGPPFFESFNDNWRDDPDQALLIQATGLAPQDDLESALVATLPPGSYTAIVSGNPEGSGVGLGVVEVYDLEPGGASTLANISTRAFVQTGNDVVIGGFILGGEVGSANVIIRAIGPSLAGFGVADPLADPTLELRDANGMLIAFDDDWRDSQAQAALLIMANLRPQNELEAAIVATLPPGAYTVIVAGKNGGTGVGLVEVYNLQ